MRNKYGGMCYRCEEWCKPGDGHFERTPKTHVNPSGWRVQHATCAIDNRTKANKKHRKQKALSVR